MTNEEISKWLMNLKDDIGKTQYQPLWHYAEALDMVIEALSAERKGKWIRMTADGVYWYECSECHEKPLLNRWHKQDEMSKFCPNCGARMVNDCDGCMHAGEEWDSEACDGCTKNNSRYER